MMFDPDFNRPTNYANGSSTPRPSLRRQGTTALPQVPVTSIQRPTLTAEEWETRAPLDEKERRSIARVQEICQSRPLPAKFASEAAATTRPGTPKSSPFLPSSPQVSSSNPASRLHPSSYPPFTTASALNDYLDLINASIEHEQEAHYRSFLHELTGYLDTCDAISGRLESIQAEVESMLEGWKAVEAGSTRVQGASEELLEERDRLVAISEELGFRLEYFQQLEEATRMLNHPGESLVLQADFLQMIERVDACFAYLSSNRQFREADLYLLRFQQCLTRAMTLIKMYFIGMLKALSSDVQSRLASKDISSVVQHHLLYSRFQAVSQQVSPLLAELERHAQMYPEELLTLLSECHTAYFTVRRNLLVVRLIEEIRVLEPGKSELVELTRAGCSYLKQLCTEEFELFRLFFNSGEDQLYGYLENLCDYLYDDLRPRILHEPQLTVLCGVCTVLQALMVVDVDAPYSVIEGEAESEEPLARLHISHLLQMVLQDAQTRLLFKAQAVLQSDIRYYAPKPDDLDYPEKLKNLQDNQDLQSAAQPEDEKPYSLFRLPSMLIQETWYPTLRKTIWILSTLHDFVNPAIFQDIAQEAIGLCRQSLAAASDLIAVRPEASKLDGWLFFVRHLLVLKEMTATLELDVVQRERGLWVDSIADTLGSLLRNTSSLLRPSNIFGGWTPSGAALANGQNSDPKIDIDSDLKRVCEDIIAMCADEATAPIRTFRERLTSHLGLKSTTATPAAKQDWGSPAALLEVDAVFKSACRPAIMKWLGKLRLYLHDDNTVAVLVPPMQARIVEEYGLWTDIIRDEYEWGTADKLMREPQVWDLVRDASVDKEQ